MLRFKKYKKNPILKPRGKDWESFAVLNCGVTKFKDYIYILYRAISKDKISRFGLAVTKDGFKITKRSNNPVFWPEKEYEALGVEDPRITQIGDEYYITYTGFKHKIEDLSIYRACLAVTKDFKEFQRLGVLLPNERNKDAVLFPEKINGKFAILHRRKPDIWLAYSDDLCNWTDHKKILYPRARKWDSSRIGASSQPIKTKEGWLLFYHGADENKTYRIGAVMLDLYKPSRVYRYDDFLLEPEEKWERKGWVNNVVFSCGAVEKNRKYFIYYGGADKCIGVATIDKKKLLNSLS